jgi:phenylacetate-CoA ligase
MFQKSLFIFAHEIMENKFNLTYQELLQSQWKSYSEQKAEQETKLRYMINFAYKNVPYYHKMFDKLKLEPSDIRRVEDLEKLPILTKDIIKQNWEDFKPMNLDTLKYSEIATSGSTGTPFQYRLSKHDRFLNAALLYRGWACGGYELGDKMVVLAGSSLDFGSKSFVIKKTHEILRNIRKLSSYDMGTEEMQQYAEVINSFKPKFIRGFASSISFFASFLHKNDIEIATPQAIFTAAEKLLPGMRKNIESVFNCEVYDNYGLNDGGVGAKECSEHNGLHIETERSIMEIVDNGEQLEIGVGRILATSLHNYSMPFIRYDTKDMGHVISDICGCGRGSKLLKEIVGREFELLETPEGKFIHGTFFSEIFWEIKEVKEFQIVQNKLDKITVKMVVEENFDEKQLDKIREIIKRRSNKWDVEFRFVDKIERTKAGKYKFIINNMSL